MKNTYTTGEMSQKTGVSIPTLRYYEDIGLLDPVTRAANGHRRYNDKDLLRIEFLKRLRATGMSIAEMQYYVNLFRAGDDTLTERVDMLAAHKQRVQEQINALLQTRDFLDMKIERYHRQLAELAASKPQNTDKTHIPQKEYQP
ncbi:MAG: MerR family transcriptional regulator, partial [Chloroflexota bacterium]